MTSTTEAGGCEPGNRLAAQAPQLDQLDKGNPMTTTANKRGLRAAAAERTAKHAQKTILPARSGVVEEARKVHAEEPVRYGEMTVEQLRAVARKLLVVGARSMRKGQLLDAIWRAEQAAAKAQTPERVKRAAAKVDAALKPTKTEAAIDCAFQTEPATVVAINKALDAKSGAKAEAFVGEALRLGWTATAMFPGNRIDTVTVHAKRGEESIDIEWIGGVFQDNCTYHHAGRTAIKLRNASAAKQRMAIEPAKANEEAQKVTAHKSVRPRAEKTTSVARSLPFTEASLDQEVLDAVYGKRITWTNGTSGAQEEDHVPAPAQSRKPKNVTRMSEGPRGRTLEFIGVTGFRSVLVSAIVRVR